MSDYIDIVEYLDEHNNYFFRPALAFISLAVAITVIPLHTQKMKFLANRFYWLYFSTYRIKLNINQIRNIMRNKTDSAQDELKKYIKQKHIALERLEGIIYKNETDRDTPQTVVEEIHVKNENMKYVFIDNNIWWYLEYYLFHFAIIGLVFLSRLLVSVVGNAYFQTNAIGNTTRLFDLTASVTLVLTLYFLDDDYRNPTSMIGGIWWQILLGTTMFLLTIGHVIIRYLPDNNINTLFLFRNFHIFRNSFQSIIVLIYLYSFIFNKCYVYILTNIFFVYSNPSFQLNLNHVVSTNCYKISTLPIIT